MLNIKDENGRKRKLNSDEQINYMKDQGIIFNIISEKEAKLFLSEGNYYFRIKAYAKDFHKKKCTTGEEIYPEVDFAFLKELSTLDMYFREVILKMSIDIEFYLKVKMLNDFQNNKNENGYDIVKSFLDKKENAEVFTQIINIAKGNGYTSDLAKKINYEKNNPDIPLWVFVELISFGAFQKFFTYYYKKYPIGNNLLPYIWSCRLLRNGAAHNSCMLNRLNCKVPKDSRLICRSSMSVLKSIDTSLSYNSIRNQFRTPFINDFISLLILYKKAVNPATAKRRLTDLQIVFSRCKKHCSYFRKNNDLRKKYLFCKRVFDKLIKSY